MAQAIGTVQGTHPLDKTDYTLVIDKSGSMMMTDMPGGRSRWDAVAESVYGIAAHVFNFDPDGLDIWLFSGHYKSYPNVRPEMVQQIFQENLPFGSTNLSDVLNAAIEQFFIKREQGTLKPNGEIILVVTDGQPDDKNAVIKVITDAEKRLHAEDHLAIQFVQVGKDRDATQFLKYLDTELVPNKQAWRDIVGTIKVEEIDKFGLQQVLLDVVTGSCTHHNAARPAANSNVAAPAA